MAAPRAGRLLAPALALALPGGLLCALLGAAPLRAVPDASAAAPADRTASKHLARRSLAALPVRPASEAAKLVADLGAGRPLVLHFWATWCAACRDEFPRLRPLLLGLEGRGVAVALVSIDDAATRAAAPAMLARLRLAKLRALVLDAPDPGPIAAALAEPGWDGTLPATFVYDAHGAKVRSFLGSADPGMLDAAVQAAGGRAR